MRIPVSLNWTFLILESDEDLVELGRRIDTVVDGKDFDTFASSAITLLATAATPQLTHGALPQRRAKTRLRLRPEQQRAGRLLDLRHHLHRRLKVKSLTK
jgi:hypothetical protein